MALQRWQERAAAAAAAITDALARVGERMPGVQSLTVSAAGVTVTMVPAAPVHPPASAPAHASCPTCGRPRE